MVNALKAHILSGPPAHGNPTEIPVSDFSAYRLHKIMNAVLANPAEEHSLEAMASVAGVTPRISAACSRRRRGSRRTNM